MTTPTTRETADHIGEAANSHIRNLRLAGGRDFAVSGYSDGLIVEQDMRGMLLAAADALENLLSEIAALNDYGRDVAKEALEYRRQRDEAVGLLRIFDDHLGEDEPMWTDDSTVTGEWIGSDGIRHSLTFGMFRRVRAFLANQGADHD